MMIGRSSPLKTTKGIIVALLVSILTILSFSLVKAQPNELPIGFPEQSVGTNKQCYLPGEPIYSHYVNQQSRPDDWLGIYSADTSIEELGLDTLNMWVWTAGSQSGQINAEFSSVKFSSLEEAFQDEWPLEEGDYFVALARNSFQPYEAVTTSIVFSVQANCNSITSNPTINSSLNPSNAPITLNPSSAPIVNDDNDDRDDNASPTNPITLSPVYIITERPTNIPTPEQTTNAPNPPPTKAPVLPPTNAPNPSPTNAPIPPPPPGACPEIPEDGCSICGEGKCVGKLDAIFTFPSQPEVPCGTLQEAGILGVIPVDQCAFLPGFVAVCECRDN